MNSLKRYELVTYFVPLLGSLSGARKSCFQFWQTSNSPPLRCLIITIPIIVTAEYWCASNIKLAHARCLQIAFQILPLQIQVEKYSKNISRILQLLYSGRGMKPLHWRPSHSTFHLLNWSLERSFGGYLVQICSGWGRGRKSPGLVLLH